MDLYAQPPLSCLYKTNDIYSVWQGGVAWQRNLLVRRRPFLGDPLALQGKFGQGIERFIKELFVFVAGPDVPSESNSAEGTR